MTVTQPQKQVLISLLAGQLGKQFSWKSFNQLRNQIWYQISDQFGGQFRYEIESQLKRQL